MDFNTHLQGLFRVARVFLLWEILFCLPGMAQQIASPLPQPPFQWQDFNVQKRHTSLKANSLVIDTASIRPFRAQPGKGAVRQSFQNAVLSGQPQVYPFEYQYEVRFSPDKRYYLAYRYDYSQPELWVHGKILSDNYKTQQSFSLPIDNGSVVHGYWIDNQANVYGIYTDAEDAVYVMRYQPATQDASWLEIGADAARRNRFVPVLGSNGILFLANVVEDAYAHWKGIVFTTFDFTHQEIKDIYFFSADELQEKLSKKMPAGRYEILDFTVTGSTMTVMVQKVGIQANRYIYDPFAVNHPLGWAARKQQVQYGERITLTITTDHKVTQQKIEDILQTKEL